MNRQELILEVAQAVAEKAVAEGHPGQVENLVDGEVHPTEEEMQNPTRLAQKLAQTLAFQRIDPNEAQQWIKEGRKGDPGSLVPPNL